MKIFSLFFLVCLFMTALAQKKVFPVTQSVLTGVTLPAGSTQDKRFLMELSAKVLLEMESKKNNTQIKTTEVLSLPVAAGFTGDSLVNQLTALGWAITPVATDNKYVWLQKDSRSVITYLSFGQKETALYFGETETAPGIAGNNNQESPNINSQQPQGMQQQTDPQQQVQQVQQTDPQQQNSLPVYSTPAGTTGITIATTNFDDGWVATTAADWVQVTKNDITAMLHYAIPLPDDLRSGDGDPILNYFWNKLIEPRYTTSNVQKRPFEAFEYSRTYFIEADGTDKNSGQLVHIAFRIFITNGIASCVEITAASKSSYQATFSDIDKIKPMLNYNKFAISAGDITGLWKESSGGFAQYYNVYNGNYAGMNAVSVNSQLTLNEQGHFTLEHKGASGMVGNQQFFTEKYNGNYSLSNWELVTTDQNGKTSTYHASYQAVKNGRVLYLQNKQYAGQEYFMVKAQ